MTEVLSSLLSPATASIVNDDVSLEFNGQIFRGFKSLKIDFGINNIAAKFSLVVANSDNGGVISLFPTDVSVVIRIGSDVVLTGWVEVVSPSASPEDSGITISGRSKAGDLVECSAVHSSGQWRRQSVEAIAEELCSPYGIGILRPNAGTGEVIDNFEIEKGESVYECIERLCRLRSLLARSTPEGDIRLARAGKRRAQRPLQRFIDPERQRENNIIRGGGSFATTGRFSEFHVIGQSPGSNSSYGEETAQGSAVIHDQAILRYRPKIMLADGAANSDDCMRIGSWEVAQAAGKAQQSSFDVVGWRQFSGGPLWEVDLVTEINDEETGIIRNDLIINALSFIRDLESSYCTITLQPVAAFDPKPVFNSDAVELWKEVKPVNR